MQCKKQNISFVTTIIICFIFSMFSIFFVNYMTKQIQAQNLAYLENNSSQEKLMLTKQVTGNWETLGGISICFSNMEISDTKALTPYIKEINDNNNFIRMGFINLDGISDLVDINGMTYQNFDFSDYDFFKESLAGKPSISETFEDPFSDSWVNYYGVPIVHEQNIIGVLCAVDSANTIRKITDSPMFDDGGFSNITDENGHFIIRSNHYLSKSNASSLSDMGISDNAVLTNILQDFKERREGSFTYSSKNQKIMAVYLPLDFNNWYIISVVPQSNFSNSYIILFGVLLIILLSFTIFAFLTIRMRKMDKKNKVELERMAFVDPITEYSSYSKFLLDVQNFLNEKPKTNFAFWYCDIKKFKFFNDLFGYDAGDKVLKYMADITAASLNDRELFCRVNADNYIGLKLYENSTEIIDWFYKLNQNMRTYETSQKHLYPLELSVGIYCSDEDTASLDINTMINRANMAQKTIKQSLNKNYAFYSGEIRKHIIMETDLESRMYQALKNNEFKVYIQPKVDIQHHNKIAGGEALVRWASKDKGLIVPGQFIPLFEKNGFITQLDRFMFRQICEWLQHYLDKSLPPLSISVNVSRLGLYQDDFLEYYIKTKSKYKIPDGILELEFTESIALTDNVKFKDIVLKLEENGFICSLDDFGSGYSSLNILKDLPMQVLKLDMLFFQNSHSTLREQIVVKNIITMAKQLDMLSVSEGVEKKEQVEFLKAAGCELVQGYIFAKPMPLENFEQLLYEKPDGISL